MGVHAWEAPPSLSYLGWRGPHELQPREGVWGDGGEHRLVLLGGKQPGVDPAPFVLDLGGETGA